MTELKYKRKPNTRSSTSQHRGKQRKAAIRAKREKKPHFSEKRMNTKASAWAGTLNSELSNQCTHTHTERKQTDRSSQENPTDREDMGTASVCGLGGVSFFY